MAVPSVNVDAETLWHRRIVVKLQTDRIKAAATADGAETDSLAAVRSLPPNGKAALLRVAMRHAKGYP